jgi:hypothetical protein
MYLHVHIHFHVVANVHTCSCSNQRSCLCCCLYTCSCTLYSNVHLHVYVAWTEPWIYLWHSTADETSLSVDFENENSIDRLCTKNCLQDIIAELGTRFLGLRVALSRSSLGLKFRVFAFALSPSALLAFCVCILAFVLSRSKFPVAFVRLYIYI